MVRRTRCSICNAPERCARVDALLARGLSLSKVAEETGYHRSIVDRHRRLCSPRRQTVATFDPHLESLIARVTRACARAERTGNVKALLEGTRQLSELRSRALAMAAPSIQREVRVKVVVEKASEELRFRMDREKVVAWLRAFVASTEGKGDARAERAALHAGRLVFLLSDEPVPVPLAKAMNEAEEALDRGEAPPGGRDVEVEKQAGAANGSSAAE